MRAPSTKARLATLGFGDLSGAEARLAELPDSFRNFVDSAYVAADPDAALDAVVRLNRAGIDLERVLRDEEAGATLWRLLGGSMWAAEHLAVHPEDLDAATLPDPPLDAAQYRQSLLEAVGGVGDAAPRSPDGLHRSDAFAKLRGRYRRHLIALVSYDLSSEDPSAEVQCIAAALADLAAAALEAGLAVARTAAAERFGSDAAMVRIAIIGMGKAGARELNYISDVDVIWVHEADGLDATRATQIATLLARETTAACAEFQKAPPLWEVDANLRPEGKDGPLTRSLDSHVAYYERWAKLWEFQALLKARLLAGDRELGDEYERRVRTMVWSSSRREGFVESVQRMRERVSAHIPAAEVDRQIKLGRGGLRDVEFTVQLLQLVHGADDESLRQRGTLEALEALAARGVIGRADRDEFSAHYRFLRSMEHRIQFFRMRRTHLMPQGDADLRRLARTLGFADAAALRQHWNAVRNAVRTLHERLFYRPLLGAVASLDPEHVMLSPEAARLRLEASGYADARGALRHIAELSSGVSRRAQIQRLLLPVLLGWFSEGADPDMGLVSFRRLSDALGETPWFLRMLRDSSVASQRLTYLLSSSRLIGALMEKVPDAASWLDDDEQLRPRSETALRSEAAAVLARHSSVDSARAALRSLRRREHLRVAIGSALQRTDESGVGAGLTAIAATMVDAALTLHARDGAEIATITLGRTGGREIGFGSDIDVMHVVRGGDDAVSIATAVLRNVSETLADPFLPFEMDAGLRPEGRNGPLVRTLDSYRAYYERWSEPWEAQALLRARAFAGSDALAAELIRVIDERRYPSHLPGSSAREVRRIKARVEAERLPRSADRSRHLKLGDGSLSDVEWLVQLLQLRHAASHPALQTTSTLEALAAAARHDLIDEYGAGVLRDAWILATRIRGALALARARSIDVLPVTRPELEAVARLIGMPAGSSRELEELYFSTTRRARKVFERLFYDGPV